MTEPHDRLDRLERGKDTIQVVVESGATHVGSIVGIVVGAVRDVTRELGDWATDVFEIRDAARRARARADAGVRAELEDADGRAATGGTTRR
ncbi:MAG TPA: hypothetical protein VGJ70_00060 [Solirubrobacteraceae bacterium]|jgi:hypothetical protein